LRCGDEVRRGGIDVGDHGLGVLVKALPEARRRRHPLDAKCGNEESVVALVLDGVEIAFSRAQEADVALDAVGVRDAVAQRDLAKLPVEARHRKRAPDQRQARVRGRRFGCRLYDLEAAHPFTCRVSCPRPARYLIRESPETLAPSAADRSH